MQINYIFMIRIRWQTTQDIVTPWNFKILFTYLYHNQITLLGVMTILLPMRAHTESILPFKETCLRNIFQDIGFLSEHELTSSIQMNTVTCLIIHYDYESLQQWHGTITDMCIAETNYIQIYCCNVWKAVPCSLSYLLTLVIKARHCITACQRMWSWQCCAFIRTKST